MIAPFMRVGYQNDNHLETQAIITYINTFFFLSIFHIRILVPATKMYAYELP